MATSKTGKHFLSDTFSPEIVEAYQYLEETVEKSNKGEKSTDEMIIEILDELTKTFEQLSKPTP